MLSASPSSPPFFARRALLSGAILAACGRKRATRYQGWLFVASGRERAVAVANLAQFRHVTTIPLPHAPDRLYYSRDRVLATSREGAELIEIDPVRFRVAARIALPGKPVAVHFLTDMRNALAVLDAPPLVAMVDLSQRRVIARLTLPGIPLDADLSGTRIAITLPGRRSIARIGVSPLKLAGETGLDLACGAIRFRQDGKTILAGASAAHEIVSLDAATGAVLVRLPLPVSPARFCFTGDGGQMFVTGPGGDVVTIVDPYQNQVDQTILAGRTPGAMAVSDRQNLLFVTNPGSGDLTILDIDTRHLSASVHIGDHPEEVLLTPDGEYALVLDPKSGNVSVVRITTVLDHKVRTKPLFTVFPTAGDARSALIVPFEAG